MPANKRTKSSKTSYRWLIPVLILLVVAGVDLLVFAANRWSITITLNGDAEQVLKYGEHYEEQGAQAVFHGSLFFRKGWPAEVEVTGNVDDSRIGTYTVIYHSEEYNCVQEASRTVTVQDTQPPEIVLTEHSDSYTLPGAEYQEEGYSATDNYDGDLTSEVQRWEKDGVVYYLAEDSSGNQSEVQRKINYNDPVPPELTLRGDSTIQITAGKDYQEPGWTAEDNCDGDLTDSVEVSGSVDIYCAGTYQLNYTVTDGYGNTTTAQRTVQVEPVRQPDTVTPGGKTIYLTFDDGPGPYTQQLLDTLEKYNVKATFFTVNTDYASLIAKEAAAGHSVGIHSATHQYNKIYASEEAFFQDLQAQRDVIYQQTGMQTTLMRFPGGSSNTVSEKYCAGIMSKLTQDVTDQGFQYFDWNVLSGDAGETTSTDTVFQNVINGVQKRKVSIVLQHDTQGFSVDAVEKIIVWGLAHDYTFLPLSSTSPTAHHSVNN